jgi:hypothetical protein
MRCNLCHPDDWVDKPDPHRPGWIRTHCKRCKRYLGSRDPTQTGELEQQTRPLAEKAKPRRKRPAKKKPVAGGSP